MGCTSCASVEALEKQLREFDETAATAAAAAEAEHDKCEAHLQTRLELQTDLLKKSDVALHASDSKLKTTEVRLGFGRAAQISTRRPKDSRRLREITHLPLES